MNTKSTRHLFLALGALVMASPALGDVSPQQKAMARRAAELDAYRQLTAQFLGLRVQSDSSAGDFVTASDRIDEELDHFVRGLRLAAESVKYYADGECEVAAEATIERTVTTRKTVRDAYGHDGEWTSSEFQETEKRTTHDVIRSNGSGTVSDATQVVDPTTAPRLPALVTSDVTARTLPPIYARVSARDRLRARRAATLDAHRKLVERICGLRITATSTVQDFLNDADEIRVTAQSRLIGARTDEVVYRPDGLVEVHVSLPVEHVVRTLQEICDEKYDGHRWTRDTFENMKTRIGHRTVSVVGIGALELAEFLPRAAEPADDLPERRHTRTERIVEETTIIGLEPAREVIEP